MSLNKAHCACDTEQENLQEEGAGQNSSHTVSTHEDSERRPCIAGYLAILACNAPKAEAPPLCDRRS